MGRFGTSPPPAALKISISASSAFTVLYRGQPDRATKTTGTFEFVYPAARNGLALSKRP
jgi:hypothetical protein